MDRDDRPDDRAERRLGGHIEPGPKAYDFRGWLAVSLPILMVESFYLLLSYTDVLVLQQFRSSEEVGVYFAVVKTLALVSFIHYAMAATTAHRFAEYHAQGDKPRLSAYVAHAIQWTFWPSLAATILLLALGKPLLWLFGPQFVVGYDIMFIAAIGLVVRSAIGPVERLLNMLGHQHICALAYALAFVMNLVLCVMLVPRFGGHGAAAATSISLAFETVLLFWIVRRRLGLHVLAFGKRGYASPHHARAYPASPSYFPTSKTGWPGQARKRTDARPSRMEASTPQSSRHRSRDWRR